MNNKLNVSPNTPDSQTRLLVAMQAGLAKSGYRGTGTAELLKAAQTPKGVLYHHYPNGKEQLAIFAISSIRKEVTTSLNSRFSTNPDLCSVLTGWFNASLHRLQSEQFQYGCAFAAVALDLNANDQALRQSLNQAFTAISACIAHALCEQGVSAQTASAWATLLICTYEGALIQARVSQDIAPAQASVGVLLALLRKELNT
jgi:TetR/AcrR family transcriptional regulator, lmrAB and yxaGH operons repressor